MFREKNKFNFSASTQFNNKIGRFTEI